MEEFIYIETDTDVSRREKIIRCRDCISWHRLVDFPTPSKFGKCDVCRIIKSERGFCDNGKQISES